MNKEEAYQSTFDTIPYTALGNDKKVWRILFDAGIFYAEAQQAERIAELEADLAQLQDKYETLTNVACSQFDKLKSKDMFQAILMAESLAEEAVQTERERVIALFRSLRDDALERRKSSRYQSHEYYELGVIADGYILALDKLKQPTDTETGAIDQLP